MTWRLVKQPNGKYARFDDVLNSFTHWDMDEKQALMCAKERGTDSAAMFRLENANKEVWCNKEEMGKLFRWHDETETIKATHSRHSLWDMFDQMEPDNFHATFDFGPTLTGQKVYDLSTMTEDELLALQFTCNSLIKSFENQSEDACKHWKWMCKSIVTIISYLLSPNGRKRFGR
jgi:hypothetical protein